MNEEVFEKPKLLPALVLAYIGDAVYEVYVRQRIIIENKNTPPAKLHKLSTNHVKAQAQSNSMKALEPLLTEDELDMYKRGRNAKSSTVPKNADVNDYRRATGFETLIGYLHLKKDNLRLQEIMKIAFENSLKKQEE